MEKHSTDKPYYPNLNGLRFIAATFVFINHAEVIQGLFKLSNAANIRTVTLLGKMGVVIFFVLSGYLITMLLLKEQCETGIVNIRKFYLRRILRIWPLYFLIIAFALLIAPNTDFFHVPNLESALSSSNFLQVTILFIFILPNLIYSGIGIIPYAAQTWSIGTEEQFYLIWPLLIKYVRNKGFLFISIILGYNLVKLTLSYLQHDSLLARQLLDFWHYFNIDCMALGALGAWLVFSKKEKILKLLYNPLVQIFTYLLTMLLLGFGVEFRYLHFEIYSFLFVIIIVNLASNKRSIISLENSLLNYLGKISYGIYMYHFIALVITARLLLSFHLDNSLIFYLTATLLTVTISSLSYHYFENYFLKLKENISTFTVKKEESHRP